MIPKRILLTGGRSLFAPDLARRFHEMGHEVYVAETSPYHVCRHSNAVKRNYIVPSPRFQSSGFISALVKICEQERIDLVIPTFEEIFCLSSGLHRFPPSCTIFCEDYQTLDQLHNKWYFNKKIESLGFETPQSFLVQSQHDLNHLPFQGPYILKPSYSRSAMKIFIVDNAPPPNVQINPHNPLVAQQYIHGKKYCTYSISHQGKLSAHAVYPQDFSIESNACLNFIAIDHPKIEAWIKDFVEKENFTGQIAFDFIETSEGKLYAIECNPRGTHGLNLFQKEDNLPEAFFSKTSYITPKLGFSKQLSWGMLLYGWKRRNFSEFLKKWFESSDVIFSKKDLKPFLFQPLLFAVYLYRSMKLKERLPAMFTFDVDWNGPSTESEQIPCEELN